MAATAPLKQSFVFKQQFETLKPSSHQSLVLKPLKIAKVDCEFKSFGNPRKWSIQCVSETNHHIGIVQNLVPSTIAMEASASLGSRLEKKKDLKKVCLFYCAETKALAERVAAESDAIELRSISWSSCGDDRISVRSLKCFCKLVSNMNNREI